MRPRYGCVDDFANPDASQRGPNGHGLCRVCGVETKPPRRTFCGEACVTRWKIRVRPGSARHALRLRDKGVCALCGLDCLALRDLLLHSWRNHGRDFTKRVKERLGLGRHPIGKTFWEADHIVPVVEGGGSCDLDGLRTLCVFCHREATAELMRRRRVDRQRRGGENRSAIDSLSPASRPA